MADQKNAFGLSSQDIQDLQAIRAQMPKGDPRTAKIDLLLASGGAPPSYKAPSADEYAASQGAPGPSAVAAQGRAALMRQLPNIGGDTTAAALAPAGDIAKMAYGLYQGAGTDPTSVEAAIGHIGTALSTVSEMQREPNYGVKAAILASPLAGVDARAIREGSQETMQNGQLSPQLGSAVSAPLIQALLAGRMATEGRVGPQIERTPPNASELLTNMVNPKKGARAFQDMVAGQENNIKQATADAGGYKNMPQLADVVRNAADAKRAHYQQNISGPVSGEPVSITTIKGYSGGTAGEGNSATIGQLEARLSQINATLYGGYEKGGLAGRAAISGESNAALNAEANGIREVLNREIGARMNMDPEAVKQARSDFGQLSNIADKIQQSLDAARFKNNNAAQAPPDVHVTVPGAINAVARPAIQAVKGKIANAALRRALSSPSGR